jgi:hypothetical protein
MVRVSGEGDIGNNRERIIVLYNTFAEMSSEI